MFTKTYELSLNKNYVKSWGILEAIRELIQNAIDSESPFVYEFIKNDDDITLVLRSEFTTLSPQTLLLGSTSKEDKPEAIGSFGEGYKIALLVLTRLGNSVWIYNGDKLWQPRFKFNSKFNEELLVVEESSNSMKHKGLTFEIHGLDNHDVDGIVDSCLRMQDHIGAIKCTDRGDILLEKPGKLYVGGLYICETGLKYGYNIKPQYIKLERDRKTVDGWDLRAATKDMWFETRDFDKIAELIEAETADVSLAKYDSPEMVKEACYKLFKARNPNGFVAESQKQADEMIERGLVDVKYVGSNFYAQVSGSKLYKEEKPQAVLTIEMQLEEWLKENRSEMRSKAIVAFKQLITKSKNWRHK